MREWKERTHFAALDWASDHHDVVVVNREGDVVESFRFAHTSAGWEDLRVKLQSYPRVAVALETNQGAAVQQLIEAGLEVYPVNPKSANAIASAKRLAESKTTSSMPGVWPTPCVSTGMAGGHSYRRIR
jgi:Transposase